MSLLGCNSKLLWHDVYQQIVDVISAKTEKTGIIVCKEFHSIHTELLENFYSYMQDNNVCNINIKFILLTEEISFIPDNILNCCEVINIARPTKMSYVKCSKNKLPLDIKVENITNIKHLNTTIPIIPIPIIPIAIPIIPIIPINVTANAIANVTNVTNVVTITTNPYNELMHPHKIICDKILKDMIAIDSLKFLKFRDYLYDIFIYNLDITDCIWYIMETLILQGKIKRNDISAVLLKTYSFLKYYNNNYRPIYHLEAYLFYLISIVHGFNTSVKPP